MEQLFEQFKSNVTTAQLAITVGVILFALFIKVVIFRLLNRSNTISRENKRKISVNTSSMLTLLVILGLIFIWSSELRSLAFSVAALGVAIVIATKEIIASFTGSLFKASNNVCSIGDRIEIKNIRGDIIDRNLMATKIMEIGPGHDTNYYTGRIVTLPNSIFLTEIVKNESALGRFTLHSFRFPVCYNSDWKLAHDILLEEADIECEKYYEEANKYIDKIQSKNNLETPTIEPQVIVKFHSFEEVILILRITVPTKKMTNIEQKIKKQFLTKFSERNGIAK